MKKHMRNKKKGGQALVEYIIIVVLVAIAAIAVVSIFGERIQEMFSGATGELGGDASGSVRSGEDTLQDLDADGLGN